MLEEFCEDLTRLVIDYCLRMTRVPNAITVVSMQQFQIRDKFNYTIAAHLPMPTT